MPPALYAPIEPLQGAHQHSDPTNCTSTYSSPSRDIPARGIIKLNVRSQKLRHTLVRDPTARPAPAPYSCPIAQLSPPAVIPCSLHPRTPTNTQTAPTTCQRPPRLPLQPILDQTCCPQYTIRLDVTQHQASSAQQALLRKWGRFLAGAWQALAAAPCTGGGDGAATSAC